jgi:hypothetical protein
LSSGERKEPSPKFEEDRSQCSREEINSSFFDCFDTS